MDYCHRRSFNILIDTGSTYNFLDQDIVAKMGWRIDTCDFLNADLADRNFVPIFELCKRLERMLQGSLFRVDFWLLP